ncbi:GNAT family N-acetyltransferase [Fundicoccus sp. Sow4_H7]|uniref:GNAT family N-acetyltransferase n=1 Tax=Fundicoccus sp. Sow4_H7 TaxID=3438784 RepID=UPI003F8DE6FB
MLKIKAVDESNFNNVIQLELTEKQKAAKWVSDNVFSLAQCWLYRNNNDSFPNAIYWNDKVVGFVLYEIEADSNEFMIWRIMIGQQFQGKGYGRKAIKEIIKYTENNYPERILVADYVQGNEPMKHLLISLGFKEVGFNEEYNEHVLHYRHK